MAETCLKKRSVLRQQDWRKREYLWFALPLEESDACA
jgi:hypothetical protein